MRPLNRSATVRAARWNACASRTASPSFSSERLVYPAMSANQTAARWRWRLDMNERNIPRGDILGSRFPHPEPTAPATDPMRIGIPRETRADETRGAATPDGARKDVEKGALVGVESGAGRRASYDDDAYASVGVEIGGREAA